MELDQGESLLELVPYVSHIGDLDRTPGLWRQQVSISPLLDRFCYWRCAFSPNESPQYNLKDRDLKIGIKHRVKIQNNNLLT